MFVIHNILATIQLNVLIQLIFPKKFLFVIYFWLKICQFSVVAELGSTKKIERSIITYFIHGNSEKSNEMTKAQSTKRHFVFFFKNRSNEREKKNYTITINC